MHSNNGSVTDQSPKPDKLNKWEKLINWKIRPDERRNWKFAFVADEIGRFEDYLSERKIATTAHFLIPVDLTEGLDLFQFCLGSVLLATRTITALQTLTILARSPFTSSWRNHHLLIEISIHSANFPHTIQS